VTGLGSGVTAVEAAGGYSCALTARGGVRCWGVNIVGQLGDGTTVDRPTSALVVGLDSGIGHLAPGGYHGCVLTRRGGVKCWGGNGNGQVGDGTTTGRLTPVDVSGSFYRPECPTLIAARHTGFTLSNGYARGSVATFTADSGYALVGTATLQCGRGQTWDGPLPTATGTGAVTASPDTGLVDGQLVVVTMSGFPAGGNLGWCQGALSTGPPSAGNCGGPIRQGQADANGTLTDPSYPVARFIFVPALNRVVDCADPAESCIMGAADTTDVAGSAVATTLTFAPPG
jgi:hypothetical protein